jgi:DNA (cytosine-5)-methyltransferase 1
MKRDALTLPLDFPGELIIDNFAGGGGTSEGLEQAFGRPVDIAINHDPEALAMHAINHPKTLHLCESVWDVHPVKVTRNQPVGLVWLSPDCKHFSKAKGGTPVEKNIRGLAWVGMRWAALTKPRVMMLENVEEFQDWGPLKQDAAGNWFPDPAKRGRTFDSFIRQLRAHGYQVDWKELRACDQGAPTIRKRLFLQARRDGIPITWPEAEHAEPTSRAVLTGKLRPFRTAAECIDFTLPAASIFDRKKDLAENTQRRVAKGLWRHVLTSAKPFIVGVGGRMGQSPARGVDQPAQTITAKADSCLATPVLAPFVADQSRPQNAQTAAADEPLRTQCAQVKGGHFTLVGPQLAPFQVNTSNGERKGQEPRTRSSEEPLWTVTAQGSQGAVAAAALAPLRGTSEGHMGGHSVEQPLSTVSAGGTHHGLMAAHITKFRTGSSGSAADEPMPTVTANSFLKRPGGAAPLGVVAAHLVDMGHGEGKDGTKRFSHGVRDLKKPLNTVTASGATSALAAVHLTHLTHHGDRRGRTPDEPLPTITGANRGEQALVAACLEQANGGFYDGDGRPLDAPISTITSTGKQQRLITAYCVKYYSSGGQWQGLAEPMHTLPTKGRMGLVQTIQVPADCLAPEHADRARKCAALLHKYLPEHFPEPADLVLIGDWVLVDITLRMLRPRELFRAQGFPEHYIIDRIPDPAILFKGGVQAADPLSVPTIPLTATAQVRMCGNSVSPYQAYALAKAAFAHEALIYGRKAA